MSLIRIRGTILDVQRALTRISGLVRFRKDYGWSPFQDDEIWDYFTENDERVCPTCEGFAGEIIGDRIPDLFPDQRTANVADTMHRSRRPHVHESVNLYPDLRGECRCHMIWRDGFWTLVFRLGREIVKVV